MMLLWACSYRRSPLEFWDNSDKIPRSESESSDVAMSLDLLLSLETDELRLEMWMERPVVVTVGRNVVGVASLSESSSSSKSKMK